MPKKSLTDAMTKADRRRKPAQVEELAPDGRAGKKVIAGHFDAAVSRQLRQLAVDHDNSVQGLLAEALNLLFEKYGKSQIA